MTNQQKVFEELKIKGDCWHHNLDVYGPSTCGKCGVMTVWRWEAPLPDFNTEAGALWLGSRVQEWKRRRDFNRWLNKHPKQGNQAPVETLTWASDSSTLYNVLCEFMGLVASECAHAEWLSDFESGCGYGYNQCAKCGLIERIKEKDE